MKNFDSLGDRQKKYENVFRYYLPMRMPVVLRLDGRGFHTYTKDCVRPFDDKLISAMNDTMIYLCENIQGTVCAYCQSDEITLLLFNYKNLNSSAWFDNNIQKMVSVSAGMASSYFTSISDKIFGKIKLATFDSRAFVIPENDVFNVLEFRQQDATRNSIQMTARSLYSHKECNNKNCSQLQEMIFQKGINWNNLPTHYKRGRCAVKGKEIKLIGDKSIEKSIWKIDNEIPIFHENIEYIMDKFKINDL